jgi:hypothetical protein
MTFKEEVLAIMRSPYLFHVLAFWASIDLSLFALWESIDFLFPNIEEYPFKVLVFIVWWGTLSYLCFFRHHLARKYYEKKIKGDTHDKIEKTSEPYNAKWEGEFHETLSFYYVGYVYILFYTLFPLVLFILSVSIFYLNFFINKYKRV